MKNLFISLFACIFCFSFIACEKTEDAPGPRINPEGHFSFKTDTLEYLSEGFYAYATDDESHIYVYGASGLDIKDAAYIAIPKDVRKGTFDFGEELFAIVTIGPNIYSTLFDGGSGQLTIESYDGVNIKGSFSFSATDTDDETQSLSAQEGVFEVTLRP